MPRKKKEVIEKTCCLFYEKGCKGTEKKLCCGFCKYKEKCPLKTPCLDNPKKCRFLRTEEEMHQIEDGNYFNKKCN